MFRFTIIRKFFSVYQARTYINSNNVTDLLKIRTKDDEIILLKFRTEKHQKETILKSVKFTIEYY